jgi:catechol 2,3-dioxygenase-like lactoylglutathione lyase family enzyme
LKFLDPDGYPAVVPPSSNARNPKAPQGNAYVAFALPDNPLQLRAHHATAAVKDIDRAVRWYRDVLGFTLAERGARNDGAMQYAEMKISGYGVGLVQLSGGAEDDGADGAHAGARGWIHLVFAVPDAARTYHLLVERGAKPYLHPGQESAPVKAFLVRDSEGNETVRAMRSRLWTSSGRSLSKLPRRDRSSHRMTVTRHRINP